jgi:bifunctional DNA-binding transcriptional regulator/antitoxin component of YhaV-PrlF toxin-antitoxin module
MPLQRVQARGQVTVTRDVRERAGIKPGDEVYWRVVGPGRVELVRLDRLSFEDWLNLLPPIEGDVEQLIREAEAVEAEASLRRMGIEPRRG